MRRPTTDWVLPCAKGDLDGAIAEGRKAIAIDPELWSARDNLRIHLLAKKDFDGVIAEYRKAIAIYPKNASLHAFLGEALAWKKDFEEAIAELHKAITIDPKDPLAHGKLGVALRLKGDISEAISECQSALLAFTPQPSTPRPAWPTTFTPRIDTTPPAPSPWPSADRVTMQARG